MSHLQGATCHVCQDAGLGEGWTGGMGGGEWQRHQAVWLAHHLSLGPSRCLSRKTNLYLLPSSLSLPFVYMSVAVDCARVYGWVSFCVCAAVWMCATFHTLVDTGPSGADWLAYGVSNRKLVLVIMKSCLVSATYKIDRHKEPAWLQWITLHIFRQK